MNNAHHDAGFEAGVDTILSGALTDPSPPLSLTGLALEAWLEGLTEGLSCASNFTGDFE